MDLFLGGYEDWKWNYLKVEVSDASGRSLVTLNGKGIARCHMRHPKSAKGGILVLNNYFREAYSFRDFNIQVLATPDMLNTTALANIKGSVTSRPAWHSYNRCTAQMQRRSWFLFCSFLPSTDCRTTGGTRCHFNFLYRVWLFRRLTIVPFFHAILSMQRTWYSSCTTRDRNRRWCGTRSNSAYWGYCASIGC